MELRTLVVVTSVALLLLMNMAIICDGGDPANIAGSAQGQNSSYFSEPRGDSESVDFLSQDAKKGMTSTDPILVRQIPDEIAMRQSVSSNSVILQSANVAVFRNIDPWDYPSNEVVLSLYGVPYSVFTSDDFGVVNLTSFSKVVIAADQNQDFYDGMNAHRSWFEDYVSRGGVLEIHAADWGWHSGGWIGPLPGGLEWSSGTGDYLTIVDPWHPVVNTPNLITDAELDGWMSSVHGLFISYPANSTVVITEDYASTPAYLEFDYGSGTILASSQTLEYGYVQGYSQILENSLLYALVKYDHDLAATLRSPSVLEPGDTAVLNATVHNVGLCAESNVSLVLLIDEIEVENASIPALSSGASYSLNHPWTPLVEATYNITVRVEPVPGENITVNNIAFRIVVVRVANPPIVSFTVYPLDPYVSETVTFDASDSYDSDGAIISYTWDFGDGFLGGGMVTTHEYAAGGTYIVTLTAIDDEGLSATRTTELAVFRSVLNVQVEAGSIHFRGEVVEFYVLVSSLGCPFDADISALLYYDGSPYQDLSYSVTYVSLGLYRIPYTIPLNAPTGTYALVVEAFYSSLNGVSLESFLLSPTLNGWNAMLVSIDGTVGTIATDLGMIELDLGDLGLTLADIEGRIATIETAVGTIRTEVSNINATLVSIDNRMATIDTALGTIQVDVRMINATLVSVDAGIATIDSAVGTLRVDLSMVNATLAGIDGRMATIESDVGMIQSDVSEINATLVYLDAGIATIDTAIGSLEVDLSSINAKLTGLNNSVATIQSSVGAITTDISNIQLRVTALNGTVATIQTSLGTLEGTVTSIDDGVATIETDIGVVHADIGSLTEDQRALRPPIYVLMIAMVGIAAGVIALVFLTRRKP